MSDEYMTRKLMEFEKENKKVYTDKRLYDEALKKYADMLIFGHTENGHIDTSFPLPLLVNIVDEQGRPKQHKENMPYRFVKGHGTGQSLAFEYSSKKINYPEMQDFEPEFYGMRT